MGGVYVDLDEDACTSESSSAEVGHEACNAPERKGWQVKRTAENASKSQRLCVVLPSPVRIYSIQMRTKGCGKLAIFMQGSEGGPNNYFGQANVASSFAKSSNVTMGLAPLTLKLPDQAMLLQIGKGEGKLNPSVAQNLCEKVFINVNPHPSLRTGDSFGISRLEITRQLSDAELEAVATCLLIAQIDGPMRKRQKQQGSH